MGSDKHYPEEAPVHRVTVDSFLIDRTPVTNRQFKDFVKATGHVTFAEIPPNPNDYPGALPHMLYAGSLVFIPRSRRVDLRNWGEWWTFLKGADWWAEEQHQQSRQSPRGARLVFRRVRLRPLGRRGFCRPKPNGSSRRAAESTTLNMPGAVNSCPAESITPTPGRAIFRGKI